MLQAADGFLEASKMQVDNLPQTTTAGSSLWKPRKQSGTSSSNEDALATDAEEASTQVRCDNILGSMKSPFKLETSKLLILNVHRMLLNCNLLEDPNSNIKIR
jgi:hypothetical protein